MAVMANREETNWHLIRMGAIVGGDKKRCCGHGGGDGGGGLSLTAIAPTVAAAIPCIRVGNRASTASREEPNWHLIRMGAIVGGDKKRCCGHGGGDGGGGLSLTAIAPTVAAAIPCIRVGNRASTASREEPNWHLIRMGAIVGGEKKRCCGHGGGDGGGGLSLTAIAPTVAAAIPCIRVGNRASMASREEPNWHLIRMGAIVGGDKKRCCGHGGGDGGGGLSLTAIVPTVAAAIPCIRVGNRASTTSREETNRQN